MDSYQFKKEMEKIDQQIKFIRQMNTELKKELKHIDDQSLIRKAEIIANKGVYPYGF